MLEPKVKEELITNVLGQHLAVALLPSNSFGYLQSFRLARLSGFQDACLSFVNLLGRLKNLREYFTYYCQFIRT